MSDSLAPQSPASPAAKSYAALTRNDPNPVKRWLQRRRLDDALRVAGRPHLGRVIDYGAGDAALTRQIIDAGRASEAMCFEPTPALFDEAKAMVGNIAGVTLVRSAYELPEEWADTAFCLEVFEHLPPGETEEALDQLERAIAPGGLLVVGVPIEIGPPALAKGLFRMARRPGAFDGRLRTILGAALGRPPEREMAPIAPGLNYYPHHLGFDHRVLLRTLRRRFDVLDVSGSPARFAGASCNSEIYILARKRPEGL